MQFLQVPDKCRQINVGTSDSICITKYLATVENDKTVEVIIVKVCIFCILLIFFSGIFLPTSLKLQWKKVVSQYFCGDCSTV